jgi:hypothetical protein
MKDSSLNEFGMNLYFIMFFFFQKDEVFLYFVFILILAGVDITHKYLT